jgi:radical SAM protein with 4Fe4S-binding SPASM domain
MEELGALDAYVINPHARLRNDKKFVIAAFPSSSAVPLIHLAPIEAVVVSLCDGKRTVAEIIDICSAMASSTSKDEFADSLAAVHGTITRHIEPVADMVEPLLKRASELTSEELNCLREYNPTRYIIRPEDYAENDLKLCFPISLSWFLTNECPVSCQYCYMPKRITRDEILAWERTREIVREAHEKGALAIYLSGGDVMCYPRLFQLLDYMKELEFQAIQIPTKAYVSSEVAKRLHDHAMVESVQISLDSTVPEVADFLLQTPGACERALASIKNLVDVGGSDFVSVKAVITPYNLPTLPKFYRDMRNLGVSNIILATYCKSGYRHDDRLFNHVDDYRWLDRQLDELSREYAKLVFYQNGAPAPEPESVEHRLASWKKRSRCTAGRDCIAICANGKVIPCEQMPEREEDYLGDLRIQSIEEVWHGARLDEYLIHPPKEKFVNTPCFDCEEYHECQTVIGQCVRNSFIHYGTRWCPPPDCPRNSGPYKRNF